MDPGPGHSSQERSTARDIGALTPSPLQPFQPQQPVVFSTNGCLGVSIADAFYGRLDGLDHRNEPHGIQSGMRVALRIMVSV